MTWEKRFAGTMQVCDFDLCDLCFGARPALTVCEETERRDAKAMDLDDALLSLIPSYWDKSCLKDIPMEKGLTPSDKTTMNKFAKIEICAGSKDFEAIQRLGKFWNENSFLSREYKFILGKVSKAHNIFCTL